MRAAQDQADDLLLNIQRSEQARREAVVAREKIVRRIAAGEPATPAELAAATDVIAGAEAATAMYQEAIAESEAAIKSAERRVAAVLRKELSRRWPLVRAVAQAAHRRRAQAQVELGDLEVLATDLRIAANDQTNRPADLKVVLARSADFAAGHDPADAGGGA